MSQCETSQIFKSIRRIVRAIDLRSREVSRASGLTIPQIVVLQGVHDLGEVTTKALSAHADLSSATVVTILDKLEDKGLIERYRSAADRRIVHARLTDAGNTAIASLPSLLHEEFEAKFSKLPEEERTQLVRALGEVAEMMNAHKIDAAAILTTSSVPQ
ncbi:MarR family winged helix-turn-helix transcriptional regulator [Roseibium sp. RKSG952]|uniref:MarR family winged helix-turn-helix transcriptional regulator n=1 Tax=Roseibium sp. RKSG952 TaxID=2529384 RepID=UPI0012BB56F5|nr:MarR family transcriptional regulator [Roseibium sp. RKSG952]MTH99841.1 MarR family transcriptional regulator [Roseibium sp. RKSG952]